MTSSFPNPNEADKNGLLCVGGKLSTELLLEAYSQGIFPWPQEGLPMLWFSPPKRGILQFKNFKIPKSVKKELAKSSYELTCNENFKHVIKECSEAKRKKQNETWILPEMIKAYSELHEKGYAWSIECWDGGEIVGGLYGIILNGVFSGESMFYKKSGASKACLVYLIKNLEAQGLKWMDIQMVTPILKLFSGEYISRKEFLNLLMSSQDNSFKLKKFKRLKIEEVLNVDR